MKTIDEAIKFSLEKVDEGLKTFTHAYPHSARINNIYQKNTNTDWTNGFWTGMLWLISMPFVRVKIHSRHKSEHFGVKNRSKLFTPITDGNVRYFDVI